jgi:hypothetical protein
MSSGTGQQLTKTESEGKNNNPCCTNIKQMLFSSRGRLCLHLWMGFFTLLSYIIFFTGALLPAITQTDEDPYVVTFQYILMALGSILWLAIVAVWVWVCVKGYRVRATQVEETETYAIAAMRPVAGREDGVVGRAQEDGPMDSTTLVQNSWSSDSSARVWGGRGVN